MEEKSKDMSNLESFSFALLIVLFIVFAIYGVASIALDLSWWVFQRNDNIENLAKEEPEAQAQQGKEFSYLAATARGVRTVKGVGFVRLTEGCINFYPLEAQNLDTPIAAFCGDVEVRKVE